MPLFPPAGAGGGGVDLQGLYLPAGELAETTSRLSAISDMNIINSGWLWLSAIALTAGQVLHNISYYSGSVGITALTNQWFSLWDGAGAPSNRLRVTVDDGATAWPATTKKTLALASTYTVPATGLYYLGIVCVGTRPPNLVGTINDGGGRGAMVWGPPPTIAGLASTAQTTPAAAPATIPFGAGQVSAANPYATVS